MDIFKKIALYTGQKRFLFCGVLGVGGGVLAWEWLLAPQCNAMLGVCLGVSWGPPPSWRQHCCMNGFGGH